MLEGKLAGVFRGQKWANLGERSGTRGYPTIPLGGSMESLLTTAVMRDFSSAVSRCTVPMSDPRDGLLELLGRYVAADPIEDSMRERIVRFVVRSPRCFERSLAEGHITGSAWIVDRTRTHALLHHHRKLGKWLQPGGHSDGEPDILSVALREAREETGLDALFAVSPEVFDLDVHEIPAHAAEAAHLHYDVRFLLEVDRSEAPATSDESYDVAWLPLAGIENWTTEESILRMVRKTQRTSPAGAAEYSPR